MKFLLKRRTKEERQQQQPTHTSPMSLPNSSNLASANSGPDNRGTSSIVAPSSASVVAPTPSPCRARSPVRTSPSPPLPPALVTNSGSASGQPRRFAPFSGDSFRVPPTSPSSMLPPSVVYPQNGASLSSRSVSPPQSGGRMNSATAVAAPERLQTDFPIGEDDEHDPFSDIPCFKDAPASEAPELFRRKLAACTIVYDFTRNTQLCAKEAKRLTLLELVEYVNSARGCFTDSAMQAILQMVSANIFRALSPTCNVLPATSWSYEPDEEDSILESSWPHLQFTYEFFLRFVVSNDVDPKSAKRFIDQQFVLRLLNLFATEDARERDYLKTILHRIYGKIMALRSFIRKAIQNTFYGFVYEFECHRGIAELLEILGSIINGFALPLKDEHKLFLERSLIPLHKARSLSAFNVQLTYCMTQYVEKDSRLAEVIINGLLRFWPATNTNKEVIFISEIEEILDLTQGPEFQRVMIALFRRFALCIQSPHFQVAERVLFLWNNEYIINLFNSNKEQLFPIIIAALYKNSRDHWNTTVHTLTYNVSKLLAEADPELFDECSDKNLLEDKSVQEEEKRKETWNKIQEHFKMAWSEQVTQ